MGILIPYSLTASAAAEATTQDFLTFAAATAVAVTHNNTRILKGSLTRTEQNKSWICLVFSPTTLMTERISGKLSSSANRISGIASISCGAWTVLIRLLLKSK